MLTSLLKTITKGKDLSERESAIVMEQIMEGTISDVQLAAFLAALTTKGASEREITAFARTMRKYSMHVPCTMDVFDIVGTGGGRTKTFNISTTASFVIAAGGVRVAKHGNRAKTSRSGSADVLEALGANIFLSPESCLDMLGQIGLCYFYTRYYYYMMKRIDAVREQLGIYTVFDVLRPLTNPAHAVYEILGVNAPHLVEPMAHVLAALASATAWSSMVRTAAMKSRHRQRRRFANLRQNRFRRMKSGRKISTCQGFAGRTARRPAQAQCCHYPRRPRRPQGRGPDSRPPQCRRRSLRRRQCPQPLCRRPQGSPPHRQRPGPAETR